MNKILVWECKWCGDLFRDEEHYTKHMIREEADKVKAQEAETVKAQKIDLINNPRLLAVTWEDYAVRLMTNLNKLQRQQISNLQFHNLRYGQQPNTHRCPVGGVKNWWQHSTDKEGQPLIKYYMGWSGKVSWDLTPIDNYKDRLEFGSFGHGLNTGTGGNVRDNKYQYNVTLFEDDFPLIKLAHKEELEWMEWKGKEIAKRTATNFKIQEAREELEVIDGKINALNVSKESYYQIISEIAKQIELIVAGERQEWKKRR